ncbi:phospholipid phosphatase-related protein type 3 [Cuculus canorus]|uniref:phospholipid phosphatase-related protein type 3 n=1 Tax=Cuculus canorus TaxID=55661 RepID=UPI0023AA2530|nr:phospholipid phosphatase-related protein type 3 [Cuculus canorus]XP_053906144.1 phospholipid phosphatase-related protein type 3 [Cuculus canorus]XP_053906145.1 phospholipid phosphatase-related protein type 3 [Cuculus canorus]XP_053906146.1 phospholipid phosphatase-related protein type 3 [Cuculus canorus]
MISSKEKTRAPKDSMTLLPCFYFVELPIVASSIVTLYFLELTDLFKPAKVGFQCYDRALSMPYVETNEELIPLLMLLSLAFAAPAASIMVGEGIVYCLQSRLKGRAGAEGSINAGGCNFNSFLRRTVRFVGVHVFGLCATALVTDVIQLATGYHAPFFLTVCKPNYTLLGTPCDANPYITQDICSGTDKHAILSARKTFPSQHATLSAFAAVYVSMYFNSIISDSTKLLKPILVFAFAIAAGVCGLTQITQYRSHPADVYVGFLIGSGIAAYLAYHAVGNFRAPTERVAAPAPAKDALRALTQRGHDSVYHQNKSVSTDELNPQTRLEEVARPVQREKNSLGSLKRASVDVDLLAPRSPMGKENMVTFSNTLPRVNTPSMDDPARRHMTIHVPVDASRSKQLITEWKQKSLEGRSMTLAEEGAHNRGAGDAGDDVPPSLYPTVQARSAERAAMGPRVLIQPRAGASQLVHIPEESQTGASMAAGSGAAVRAKWVMVAEKTGAQRVANPPRLMQVIAMSKQQSMVSVTPKHSETSSSSTSSDSSQYRSPSERDSASIITIDAHAPHHPVVHLSAGNGPWEWKSGPKGPEGSDGYELGEMGKDFRGFHPAKSAGGVSPGSSVSDMEQDEPRYGSLAAIPGATGGSGERGDAPPEGLLGTASRESTLRRKPAEREGTADSEVDHYYKKMQTSRRFKD